DDFLVTSDFPTAVSQPTTVFLVAQTTRPRSGDAFFDGLNTWHLIDNDGTNYRIYAGAPLSATVADTLAHVIAAKFNGNSSSLAVDGGARYTGAAGTRPLTRITLGIRGDQ